MTPTHPTRISAHQHLHYRVRHAALIIIDGDWTDSVHTENPWIV
jgi:hypothetical protein